jgi:hypothetical protein
MDAEWIALTIVLKFAVLVVMFVPAVYISRWLRPRMRDGRLKRILFYRLE